MIVSETPRSCNVLWCKVVTLSLKLPILTAMLLTSIWKRINQLQVPRQAEELQILSKQRLDREKSTYLTQDHFFFSAVAHIVSTLSKKRFRLLDSLSADFF